MSAGRAAGLRARRGALDVPPGRAARFARRMRGEAVPGFDALARVPLWRLHPAGELPRIALAAGLLHYRARIDAELSGARLKPLAAACGEALFDRACAAPAPPPEQLAAGDVGLPDPEELLVAGRRLLENVTDPAARALAARAVALVGAGT